MAFAGPVNRTGPPGPPGQDGIDGAQWLVGDGVPDSSLGSPGDFFLDREKADIYRKSDLGNWLWELNIRGPRGLRGRDGEDGKTTVVASYSSAGGGGGSTDPRTLISDIIPAGSNKIVDTIALSAFKWTEYEVRVNESGQDEGRFFKMYVSNEQTGLRDNLFSILGRRFSMLVEAEISGSNMVLKITNNEVFDLQFRASRIQLN